MATTHVNKYQVNNVVEAFTIVDYLIDNNSKLGLSQISRLVGCTKNKAFRLLATLELCGIVEKDLQNKYTIGFPTFQAARKIMSKKCLNERVRPFLTEISGLINESTYLAYIGAEGLLLVDYVDCSRPIKVASLVGKMVKLEGNSECSTGLRSLNYIGDIMVTTGVFDPEVTAVIAPFDDYTSSGCGALVVIAPSCRMPLVRIKSEIVPTLRAVMQFHSLSKPNEQNMAKALLFDEPRTNSSGESNEEKLKINRSKLHGSKLNRRVGVLKATASL